MFSLQDIKARIWCSHSVTHGLGTHIPLGLSGLQAANIPRQMFIPCCFLFRKEEDSCERSKKERKSHRRTYHSIWSMKTGVTNSLAPHNKYSSLLSIWLKDTKDWFHLIKKQEQVQRSGINNCPFMLKNHKAAHGSEDTTKTSGCSYYWGNRLSWPGSHFV